MQFLKTSGIPGAAIENRFSRSALPNWEFAEAGELYARMVVQDPKDFAAVLGLGRVALLSDQFHDAQKWLEQAVALQPNDADAKVMLAEAFYRRDDFQKAAASLNGVEAASRN